MKLLLNILFYMPLLMAELCSAQSSIKTYARVHRDTLKINEKQTTNILFAHPITVFDRGSADILAQRSPMAADLLQIKASGTGFENTNLSVLCADGSLHVFNISYEQNPTKLIWEVGDLQPDPVNDSATQARKRYHARALKVAQLLVPSISVGREKQQIGLRLNGIYISEDQMYFHVKLTNKSYIPFDISRLALYSSDGKRARRGAHQEIEIPPLYVLGDVRRLERRSAHSVVLVTPKLSLGKGKELRLQLWEDQGGRHQQLVIKNKHLIKAVPLN